MTFQTSEKSALVGDSSSVTPLGYRKVRNGRKFEEDRAETEVPGDVPHLGDGADLVIPRLVGELSLAESL